MYLKSALARNTVYEKINSKDVKPRFLHQDISIYFSLKSVLIERFKYYRKYILQNLPNTDVRNYSIYLR